MDLGSNELAILETYRRWRQSPPTYWTLMVGNDWRRFLLLGIATGIIGYICFSAGVAQLGLLFLGAWIGELIAESARLRHTARVWPILSQTLDWNRVEVAINHKRLD